MSSNKTTNLNLHSWVGSDKVLRTEFVDNFNKIDAKFNATSGHSHDGKAGSGGKISATSVDYTSEKNVKQALDELFQSANRYIKSIADTIGDTYDEKGSATIYNMANYYTRTFEERLKIIRAIDAKHGYTGYNDTVADLEQRILGIPYNLEPQGTADAIDVAKGETFLNRTAALITGTKELVSSKEYVPSTSNTTATNAIHENSKIKGEPQLVPANIKNGTTIFGVTGSYVPVPGYNVGDSFDYVLLNKAYSAQGETSVDTGDLLTICAQGCVWSVKKENSQHVVKNLSNPSEKFTFTPYTDVKCIAADFFGIYMATSDMVYCYDYMKLTHKWGVSISSFIASGDMLVGICTNRTNEILAITQKGRVYILDYKDGSLKDMYKMQESYTKPINISKVRQRFSCDDIVLIDEDNKLSFYIDSEFTGDNNARVLYWSKDITMKDVITNDIQDSYILLSHDSISGPQTVAYIYHYNYREASSSTIALQVGKVVMDSVPERILLIEDRVFLIVSPSETIVYDAGVDLVLFRGKFGYKTDGFVFTSEEMIYGNNKSVHITKTDNDIVKYMPGGAANFLALEENEETNSLDIILEAKDITLTKVL